MSESVDKPDPLKDPATLELIFHAALKNQDPRGVEAALRLLAVVDPHRCRELLDLTRLALWLRTEGKVFGV